VGQSKITFTIVFDNVPFHNGLSTSWGYSCLVEGADKNILFDTGGDGAILTDNMRALGIDSGGIDAIVLSHEHSDHTGGLRVLLDAHPGVSVYLPHSFTSEIKSRITAAGGRVVEVDKPVDICPGVRVTGVLGKAIPEESLLVETGEGPVLITGCAHPGIVEIVEKANELTEGRSLYLVMGGFHMRETERNGGIVARLRELGVQRAGPSHCSTDNAREHFQRVFGSDFVPLGVGATLSVGFP
jgi:7,8-dihydropterin-6-yl-methyl-4-(beta-D-ribofuranosyl)aminobenzene 5'-phosphate synthase